MDYQDKTVDADKQKVTSEDPLDFISDVTLQVRLVMGQVELTIGEILKLKKGSVIPLQKEKNEPFELHANGNPVASGEVVVVNDHFGVRITNIIDPEAR